MMNQTIQEVDALTRVVHIYMNALAKIAACAASPDTPLGTIQALNAPLIAIQALQDGAALMEERTDHRP